MRLFMQTFEPIRSSITLADRKLNLYHLTLISFYGRRLTKLSSYISHITRPQICIHLTHRRTKFYESSLSFRFANSSTEFKVNKWNYHVFYLLFQMVPMNEA